MQRVEHIKVIKKQKSNILLLYLFFGRFTG